MSSLVDPSGRPIDEPEPQEAGPSELPTTRPVRVMIHAIPLDAPVDRPEIYAQEFCVAMQNQQVMDPISNMISVVQVPISAIRHDAVLALLEMAHALRVRDERIHALERNLHALRKRLDPEDTTPLPEPLPPTLIYPQE